MILYTILHVITYSTFLKTNSIELKFFLSEMAMLNKVVHIIFLFKQHLVHMKDMSIFRPFSGRF